MLLPTSGLKSKPSMKPVTGSPKTSVDYQRTSRHSIPERRTFYNYCCENLKSYKKEKCLREELDALKIHEYDF
jgi:hypothetical protein